MYHFFSAVGAATAPPSGDAPSAAAAFSFSAPVSWGTGSSPASVGVVPLSAIDELREVRPDEVEQAEDERRDDRHDDHDDRGLTHFLGVRPRHLLQLVRDLV